MRPTVPQTVVFKYQKESREDAAAFGRAAAAESRSRAVHALKLTGSERPSERRVRLCPSKAERCPGDTGAPTGAGPLIAQVLIGGSKIVRT